MKPLPRSATKVADRRPHPYPHASPNLLFLLRRNLLVPDELHQILPQHFSHAVDCSRRVANGLFARHSLHSRLFPGKNARIWAAIRFFDIGNPARSEVSVATIHGLRVPEKSPRGP
jgi:hypothetical protein